MTELKSIRKLEIAIQWYALVTWIGGFLLVVAMAVSKPFNQVIGIFIDSYQDMFWFSGLILAIVGPVLYFIYVIKKDCAEAI